MSIAALIAEILVGLGSVSHKSLREIAAETDFSNNFKSALSHVMFHISWFILRTFGSVKLLGTRYRDCTDYYCTVLLVLVPLPITGYN